MTRLESKNLLVLSYLLIIVVAVLRIEMINLYNIVAVFSCLLFFAATRPAREIVLRLSLFMGVNIFMTWTRTAKSPSAIATELSVPPRPRDWPLKRAATGALSVGVGCAWRNARLGRRRRGAPGYLRQRPRERCRGRFEDRRDSAVRTHCQSIQTFPDRR